MEQLCRHFPNLQKVLTQRNTKFNENLSYFTNFFYLCLVSRDGKSKYSEVRTFFHKEPLTTSLYVSVMIPPNMTTYLTASHLIYVQRNGNDKFNVM